MTGNQRGESGPQGGRRNAGSPEPGSHQRKWVQLDDGSTPVRNDSCCGDLALSGFPHTDDPQAVSLWVGDDREGKEVAATNLRRTYYGGPYGLLPSTT